LRITKYYHDAGINDKISFSTFTSFSTQIEAVVPFRGGEISVSPEFTLRERLMEFYTKHACDSHKELLLKYAGETAAKYVEDIGGSEESLQSKYRFNARLPPKRE